MSSSEDLCGRCLIVFDARCEYVAEWESGSDHTAARRPQELADWVEAVMIKAGGDARFSMWGRAGMLIPVSTWQGDRICEAHLWERRDAEVRGGGR